LPNYFLQLFFLSGNLFQILFAVDYDDSAAFAASVLIMVAFVLIYAGLSECEAPAPLT
jgi:hypothetical protein